MTRKQCKKCPWRVDVDPFDIPDGYCPLKHAALANTIAEPGAVRIGGTLRMMACHESKSGGAMPCVGWLVNQIGPGNNIALRMAVMVGRVDGDVATVGAQHPTLEDTLSRGDR
jgi:hypothetical protein